MPRTIAYRAGGFTNCGIGYTKFSQEELAEMKDRVMTENEVINILRKDSCYECAQGTDSPVNCEYEECRVAEATREAIKALKEVQQYRAIGTVEKCRAAVEMQTAISRELIEGKYFCPKCHNLMPYPGYCGCGQKVY
jgi:hypothetical protein